MIQATSLNERLADLQAEAVPQVKDAMATIRAHLVAIDEEIATLRRAGFEVGFQFDQWREQRLALTRFSVQLSANIYRDDPWTMCRKILAGGPVT